MYAEGHVHGRNPVELNPSASEPVPAHTSPVGVTPDLPHSSWIMSPERDRELNSPVPTLQSLQLQYRTPVACARCLNTIELSQGPGMSAQDKPVHMWVLLCGHMLDTKCFREVGRPAITKSEFLFLYLPILPIN